MKLFQSSSMIFKSFLFQILCIICCILAISSYSIEYRPPYEEDRDERAVTEWRFRRNYLFKFPNFYRSQFKTGRLFKQQGNGYNPNDGNKILAKKFIIPQLVHPPSE